MVCNHAEADTHICLHAKVIDDDGVTSLVLASGRRQKRGPGTVPSASDSVVVKDHSWLLWMLEPLKNNM